MFFSKRNYATDGAPHVHRLYLNSDLQSSIHMLISPKANQGPFVVKVMPDVLSHFYFNLIGRLSFKMRQVFAVIVLALCLLTASAMPL